MLRRSGKAYVVSDQHQGRNDKKRGVFEGTKQRNSQRRRSKRMKPASIDHNSDDKPAYSDTEPPVQVKRSIRKQPITCLTFGKLRKHQFPYHFFCANCDAWEAGGGADGFAVHCRKSAKQSSRTFKCEANHTSAIYPTTKRKDGYLPSTYKPVQRQRTLCNPIQPLWNDSNWLGSYNESYNSDSSHPFSDSDIKQDICNTHSPTNDPSHEVHPCFEVNPLPEAKDIFSIKEHDAEIHHQELWEQVQHLEEANTRLKTTNAAL